MTPVAPRGLKARPGGQGRRPPAPPPKREQPNRGPTVRGVAARPVAGREPRTGLGASLVSRPSCSGSPAPYFSGEPKKRLLAEACERRGMVYATDVGVRWTSSCRTSTNQFCGGGAARKVGAPMRVRRGANGRWGAEKPHRRGAGMETPGALAA